MAGGALLLTPVMEDKLLPALPSGCAAAEALRGELPNAVAAAAPKLDARLLRLVPGASGDP